MMEAISTDNVTRVLTKNEAIAFSWYDYLIFVVMMGMSIVIGIYFGCFGTKQESIEEYLVGKKQMTVIPTAVSLISR